MKLVGASYAKFVHCGTKFANSLRTGDLGKSGRCLPDERNACPAKAIVSISHELY